MRDMEEEQGFRGHSSEEGSNGALVARSTGGQR